MCVITGRPAICIVTLRPNPKFNLVFGWSNTYGLKAVILLEKMKTKVQKQENVKELTAKFKAAGMVAFTTFSQTGEKGLSVAQTQTLKRELRANGAEYIVTKKRLVNLARQMAGLSSSADTDQYTGALGVVVGEAAVDKAKLAKSLYGFSKANPALRIFGALLDKSYINAASFVELAKLPSREVLIGRLLGMMQYPIKGLMNAVSGNSRKLVMVLNQIAINKQ